MPRVIPNLFTTIEFTEEEEKEAKTIPPLFKLFLMSKRGEIAIRKNNLMYDPEKLSHYLQEEAALAGQIRLLTELIGDA